MELPKFSVTGPVPNSDIAQRLKDAADALERQGADVFRCSAYRRAAATILEWPTSVSALFEERGVAGLQTIPGVGTGISLAIAEMLTTGQWALLERLRGQLEPENLLRGVPGVGSALARRLHSALQVETLDDLEEVARRGALRSLPGVGPRRAEAIVAWLAERLRRGSPPPPPVDLDVPSVEDLLDVDREYRTRAAAGSLPTIAPKRRNPSRRAWLPILHTQRGRWHFTALYSNTAHAHRLGKTHDWVVIYYYDSDQRERQCTVITGTVGSDVGRRLIRGREAQSRAVNALALVGGKAA